MEYKDYYKILGVDRDADADTIKRAYRKLARKYHPDVSTEADAEDRFKEVQEAYEVLKDPDKRQAYDQMGNDWQGGQDFRPPPGWENQRQEWHFSDADLGGGDFSDFFESLFGGGRQQGRSAKFRGQDQRARLRISLEDAYHGATRSITLNVPETDDQGRVRQQPRELKVRIPAGVTAGQHIRLRGQGGQGFGGGQAGDLLLEVEFEPHPQFQVDGRDIHLDLPIAPWEAALGGKVPVPTLGGQVNLSIPAGSQTDKQMRLKGRGLPGKPAGDQIVRLRIVTPPANSDTVRQLYEQMRDQTAFDPRKQRTGGSK
ncbi:curved DNA-binding protein [Methylohalomonas lacus]|uniref:Curved DNA-binding protein n=1 Tax=Methylohalomonas lacus TaxID=398773 RepID=A0AAE3HHU1_9GAMM|nr:DnaJ C-terminal domain-containing protein [Methylohalomonas lacus]MCS3902610.1 curved DNA-binding protein [Methylohalomonas lacus]